VLLQHCQSIYVFDGGGGGGEGVLPQVADGLLVCLSSSILVWCNVLLQV
jgi:hypothetical protein